MPFGDDDIDPMAWYPYAALIRTLEQMASTLPSQNILFFAGINFLRIWYEQGPGKEMIHSGLDWLHANDQSGGYNSVVRGGSPEEIGWCLLQSIDIDQGIAIYDNVAPLPADYVRGVFYGGCILFNDMEYVDVDVSETPFTPNPLLRRLTVTVRFRLKSPQLDTQLVSIIGRLQPGEPITLANDEVASLAWRFKGLQLKDQYLAAYQDDVHRVLASALRELQQTAGELKAAKERLEAASAAGIVGIWEWDVQADQLVWDKVTSRLYGLTVEAFSGNYDAWLHAVHMDDRVRVQTELEIAVRNDTAFSSEFRVVCPNQAVRYIKAVGTVTPASQSAGKRILGVNYDVTEQKRIEHELDQLAFYDRLTGLPNRRLLEDRLERLLAYAQRRQETIGVIFLDLDRFKPINDQYGHAVGDWLLQGVATRMQASVRASDTVARIGGDEFIVLLPDAGTPDEATAVAEKIRLNVETPFLRPDGQSLEVSASLGLALYPHHAHAARDLLHFADDAMYRAKKAGRNSVATATARIG